MLNIIIITFLNFTCFAKSLSLSDTVFFKQAPVDYLKEYHRRQMISYSNEFGGFNCLNKKQKKSVQKIIQSEKILSLQIKWGHVFEKNLRKGCLVEISSSNSEGTTSLNFLFDIKLPLQNPVLRIWPGGFVELVKNGQNKAKPTDESKKIEIFSTAVAEDQSNRMYRWSFDLGPAPYAIFPVEAYPVLKWHEKEFHQPPTKVLWLDAKHYAIIF